MVTVGVGGDDAFKSPERLLCKFDSDPVCQLVGDRIACRKTLHQMIVHPTARLVEQMLCGDKFLTGGLF